MLVNFMKSDALDLLEEEMPNNVSLYNGHDKWVGNYFEEKGMSSYSFSTGITVPDVSLTIGDSKTDFENAVKLFDAFKGKLNLVQASDLRLWAYLAHDTYWEYMRTRWAIDVASEDDDENTGNKQVARIGARYFFKASKGKAFVRQGIARLYWSAYLTYDEENVDDPYELTRYFLSKQDIFAVSTERALARNKILLLAALRVLKENGDLKRAQVRRFFLTLNEAGGVVILDSLSKKDANDLARRTLEEVLTGNPSEDETNADNNSEHLESVNTLSDSSTDGDSDEASSMSKIRVQLNSKVIAENVKTGTKMPLKARNNSFQTKPALLGLKIGDEFKIRKDSWKIISIT